jgi:hypothetical protein
MLDAFYAKYLYAHSCILDPPRESIRVWYGPSEAENLWAEYTNWKRIQLEGRRTGQKVPSLYLRAPRT